MVSIVVDVGLCHVKADDNIYVHWSVFYPRKLAGKSCLMWTPKIVQTCNAKHLVDQPGCLSRSGWSCTVL